MDNIEIIKVAVAAFISISTFFTVLYKRYKNERSKRILSSEEFDFILSRGDTDDQLNKELPLLKERQLIEKTYGFSASRKEFNSLVYDLKGSQIRLTQLKRINSYLLFKNNKTSISLGGAEWVLFVLNTICAFVFLAIAIVIAIWAKDEPYRFIKIVGLFVAVLFPVYFVMYPTFLAWQVKKAVEGTGGSFDYYELGKPLFLENEMLNEEVELEKIREYVWYSETRQIYTESNQKEEHLLGLANSSAYYFYYLRDKETTLDDSFLRSIKTKAEQYIIYADNCLLDDALMQKYHIVFKKIPRDITRF